MNRQNYPRPASARSRLRPAQCGSASPQPRRAAAARFSFGRMARSLANILYKGIAAYPAARPTASGSIFAFPLLCPAILIHMKILDLGLKLGVQWNSLKDIVDQDIKENHVMIYTKGVPQLPRCGFSALAVRVLKEYNVPLGARNVLEDLELKNAVKSFSHWPTFPQIFRMGSLLDIILNIHQTGELKVNAGKEQ